MYLIVGLGNPSPQYEKTRHNVGFDAVDMLASQLGTSISTKKHKGLCATGMIGSEKVILLKPQTFMNLSGESVRAAVDFYKIDPETELIVLYDDINLDIGKLRIRDKGSAGGHNGMKNIINHLGMDDFTRIRIGVGDKGKMNLADFVLSRFSIADRKIVDDTIEDAASAVAVIILEGVQTAQNKFN